MIYEPPVADIVHAVDRVCGLDGLLARPTFAELDTDTVREVLERGADFVRGCVAPQAAAMDAEGCRLEHGRVVLPRAFAGIWQGLADGGWLGLSLPRAYGGHGLPQLVQAAFSEMLCGACVPAAMLPLLVRGAAGLVAAHAKAPVQRSYLDPLIRGAWAATICITEPDAGSDVPAIRTRARRRGDGIWTVTGTKIFISFGDHALTDGILHMVLARTGERALGLFAVPAFNDARRDGSVVPLRIEHKLGLHASPTCAMQFDDAPAFVLGAPDQGLKIIFSMINAMRLEVAVQGVGIAGAAGQAAQAYAQARRQGSRGNGATPIAQHPDVQRNLLTMRALTEPARVLVYEVARLLDMAQAARDAQEHAAANDLAAFLLPVCKAGCAELAVTVADLALQVHGGHGYIRDSGMERLYRDARILPIYEGTTGIQAIDLVLRKLPASRGLDLFVERIRVDMRRARAMAASSALAAAMEEALGIAERCAQRLRARLSEDRDAALAGATPFLRLLFRLGLGWAWLRILAAEERNGAATAALAPFYAEQLMPEIALYEQQTTAPSAAWAQAVASMT